MSQWYYNKDGQAHGPLKTEDMESRIKNGEIGPLDLVFEVGTTEWKALSQVPVLEAFIVKEEPEPEPAPAPPAQGSEDGPQDLPEWVLLKKVKVDGKSQFKQMGPYTKAQVLDFIDQGKVLFQDFIWKTGMESWQPVSAVETFQVPLPSSPPLETAIYKVPGAPDQDASAEKKDSDDNELGSLTELVEIEKYQREKTQMVSAEQLRKQWIQDDQAKAVSGGDEKKSESGDLWSLVPPSEEAPQKSKAVDTSEEKNSLFSLKKAKSPKPKKAKAAVEVEAPVEDTVKTEIPQAPVVPKTIAAKEPPAPEKKKTRPQPRDEFTDEIHGGAPGMGIGRIAKIGAALLVFVITTVFLFSSMDSDESGEATEVAENTVAEDLGVPPIEEPPPAAVPDSASPEVVKQLQEKLQAYKAKLAERERQIEQKRVARQAKKDRQRKQREDREAKKRLAEERRAAKEEAQRRLASENKKPKPKPKPVVRAKPAPKPKPKPAPVPVIKRSKIGRNGIPSAVGGSLRSRSYYLQRDRKALFYTALDAERLVTDLEGSYKELKRNKAGWKKFYRGWKGRLSNSTPSLIRNFPSSREDYAYPREIAAFKNDHSLLKDYGALHNAKVLGLRVPASPGKNLTQTFVKHREKAKNLRR